MSPLWSSLEVWLHLGEKVSSRGNIAGKGGCGNVGMPFFTKNVCTMKEEWSWHIDVVQDPAVLSRVGSHMENTYCRCSRMPTLNWPGTVWLAATYSWWMILQTLKNLSICPLVVTGTYSLSFAAPHPFPPTADLLTGLRVIFKYLRLISRDRFH